MSMSTWRPQACFDPARAKLLFDENVSPHLVAGLSDAFRGLR